MRSSTAKAGFALIARFTFRSSSSSTATAAWFFSRKAVVAKRASSLAFSSPSGRTRNLSGASFMTNFVFGPSRIDALMVPFSRARPRTCDPGT